MVSTLFQSEVNALESQVAQLQAQIAAAQSRIAALGEAEVTQEDIIAAMRARQEYLQHVCELPQNKKLARTRRHAQGEIEAIQERLLEVEVER